MRSEKRFVYTFLAFLSEREVVLWHSWSLTCWTCIHTSFSGLLKRKGSRPVTQLITCLLDYKDSIYPSFHQGISLWHSLKVNSLIRTPVVKNLRYLLMLGLTSDCQVILHRRKLIFTIHEKYNENPQMNKIHSYPILRIFNCEFGIFLTRCSSFEMLNGIFSWYYSFKNIN